MAQFEITQNKSKEKCYFCGKPVDDMGIVLSNYKDSTLFRFMPKGKIACMECYIENGVKQSIKKHLKGRY